MGSLALEEDGAGASGPGESQEAGADQRNTIQPTSNCRAVGEGASAQGFGIGGAPDQQVAIKPMTPSLLWA
jgi:hypothetical protein